jgi:hypothetical protein
MGIEAVAGVRARETRVGAAVAVTDRAAVPLTPLRLAEMVADPAATPVARPAVLMVASAVLLEDQLTLLVTFEVELSLYVAVAVNCCAPPRLTLVVEGVTAIEVMDFVAEPVELLWLEPQPVNAKATRSVSRQRGRYRKY